MPAVFAKPQQVSAAHQIERIFSEGRIHYCFLNADVQSGKTGCFQQVIRRMLQTGMIDRAYILCGSTDTELYAQAKSDTVKYNEDLQEKITVIFRQDFPKHSLDVKKALIVVDESHMDQNVRNKLAEYLGKFGLGMDGTRDEMLENKTYILSVDATGYSEISAIQNGMSRPKAIVSLEPGTGYWGPEQYYNETFYNPGGQKLLQSTFAIASNPEQFKALFQPNTWNLMRVCGGKKETKTGHISTIKQLCAQAGVDVYFFNSVREDVIISCDRCEAGEPHTHTKPCLSAAPPRPALVLLDGRLRAGKVVPKRHVGFVWEGAKISNTDAVIQGLLGRMCGYAFGERKPTIFVPGSLLKKHVTKEVTWCELERHIFAHSGRAISIPTKATNIVPGRNPKRLSDGKHRCPPIRFHLGEDEEWADERRDAVLKDICLAKLREPQNLALISDHPNLSDEQKEEILLGIELMVAARHETSLRNIEAATSASQKQYLSTLVEAERSNTIPLCQDITDPKLVNFVVVHPTLRLEGVRGGDVLVVFYTQAQGPLVTSKPAETMFGSVKKACAFVRHTIKVRADTVACASVGLRKEHFVSQDAFRNALEAFIRARFEDEAAGFAVTPCLQFLSEERALSKAVFAYTDSKHNAILTILRQIEQALAISCSVRFVRGGVSTQAFQIESISWKRRV